MNIITILIQTLCGLALFILGMKTMSEGLQRIAGGQAKRLLAMFSNNRVIGCVTGAAVTALIQSSSATTVMLIGFVNAGLMGLNQAVGVILGANVGTTMTAQLIAFKISDAAMPAIALGMAINLFGRTRRWRNIGAVILGFGLLFYGLMVMTGGLAPIKKHPEFVQFFTRFDASSFGGMILCVFTGALLTIMVQSSSATVGLTMSLALQGLLSFPSAVALVLGENIGTTITAELATIGGGENAHRAARAHTMFNVLGVSFMVVVFPYFVDLVQALTSFFGAGPVDQVVDGNMVNVSRYIANAHTMFNVLNAIFWLVMLPWLVKVATWCTKSHEDPVKDLFTPPQFDSGLVDNPSVALLEVRRAVMRMSDAVELTMREVVGSMKDRDLKKLYRWRQREEAIDAYQREITTHLTAIYQSRVDESDAKEISTLLRMSNNLERVGDAVEKVAHLSEELIENNVQMAPDAIRDIETISGRVVDFMHLVTETSKTGTPPEGFLAQAERLEDEIDLMREEMRQGYIERLRSGVCTIDPSLTFIDMLTAFEKMGDYCYNIAQALARVK